MTSRPTLWVPWFGVVFSVLATLAIVAMSLSLAVQAFTPEPTTTTTPGVVLIPPASVTREAGA